MPFQYTPYQNRYVGSIADLMGRGRDAEAQALITAANAQAQAAQASGQAWGGAIQGIGNTIAAIPGQMQAQQDRKLALEDRALERAERQGNIDYTAARTGALEAQDVRSVSEAARAAEREIRLKSVLGNPDGYTWEDIVGVVGLEKGIEIATGLASLQVDPPEPLSLEDRSTHLRNIMRGFNALSPEMQIEQWPAARARALANTALGLNPADIPVEFDPAWFTQMLNFGVEPTAPAPPGPPVELSLDGQPTVFERDPETNKLVPIGGGVGPRIDAPRVEAFDVLENNAGEQRYVRKGSPEARNLLENGWRVREPAVASETRPPSQAEYLASTYAGRMVQSEEVFERISDDIVGMNVLSFSSQQWADSPTLQSDTMQAYMQAARNFINALLRRESGAVIADSEFDSAEKQYLPLPNDSADTMRQKAANRQYVTDTMVRSAGAAYEAPGSLGTFAGDNFITQEHYDADTGENRLMYWHDGKDGGESGWYYHPPGMPFPQEQN